MSPNSGDCRFVAELVQAASSDTLSSSGFVSSRETVSNLWVVWEEHQDPWGVLGRLGWEGIHLYIFRLRAAPYSSSELSAFSPDVSLADLRFRKGAWLNYEYDLNIPWRHEIRIEDRLEREVRKTYPVCTGGDDACPPEDCGGPESFMD